MAENGATKVRFDLWAVLGFLVLLTGLGMGYLFNAQAIARDERQAAIASLGNRVTLLEANFKYIADGIFELKQGQKSLEKTIDDHEHATLTALKMKRWQDIPASR